MCNCSEHAQLMDVLRKTCIQYDIPCGTMFAYLKRFEPKCERLSLFKLLLEDWSQNFRSHTRDIISSMNRGESTSRHT